MEGRLVSSYVVDQLTTCVIDYLEVRMASEKLAERGRDASDCQRIKLRRGNDLTGIVLVLRFAVYMKPLPDPVMCGFMFRVPCKVNITHSTHSQSSVVSCPSKHETTCLSPYLVRDELPGRQTFETLSCRTMQQCLLQSFLSHGATRYSFQSRLSLSLSLLTICLPACLPASGQQSRDKRQVSMGE